MRKFALFVIFGILRSYTCSFSAAASSFKTVWRNKIKFICHRIFLGKFRYNESKKNLNGYIHSYLPVTDVLRSQSSESLSVTFHCCRKNPTYWSSQSCCVWRHFNKMKASYCQRREPKPNTKLGPKLMLILKKKKKRKRGEKKGKLMKPTGDKPSLRWWGKWLAPQLMNMGY